jgi:tartrate-resistant acid phosphatase type 5
MRLFVFALLLGFGVPQQADARVPTVSFVAVGDTGYIPSYERYDEDDVPLRTLGDYLAAEAQDWLERNPDMTGFTPTPWTFESALGGFTQASGMYPVAWAAGDVCRTLGCDFAAMLGDNIYPDGATLGADGIADERRFKDMLDSPYGRLGAGVENFRIYAMMGNHDWRISREATVAQMRYLQDHPNFAMPDLFYRISPPGFEGMVELFVIDTEMLLAGTTVHKDKLDADGREVRTGELESWDDYVKPSTPAEREMTEWLARSLASSTARWKIVLGHHALWSGGGSKYEKARALRALLMPSLCAHADAYIAGDDHMLEAYTDDCAAIGAARSEPLVLLVSGAGSKYRPLAPRFMAHQNAGNPGMRNLWSKGSTWGLVHVTLDEDTLTARFFTTPADMSGQAVGEGTFVFPRRPAASRAPAP